MNKKILKRNLICVFVTALVAVMMLTVGVMADDVAQIGTTTYSSLEDAIAAAKSSNELSVTITLLSDVETSETIVWEQASPSLTIDLNNHNITKADTSTSGNVFDVFQGTFTLTGTGKVTNLNGNSAVRMKGSATDTANYTVVTIDENVELVANYAMFVTYNGSHGYGVVANINGTLTGSLCGFYVNGVITDTTGNIPVVNVNSTASITASNDGACAMYLAGYASTTIADGALVSSPEGTGIEIRAGELTVNGGTITGGDSTLTSDPNGSGSTTSGAGISIVQHTTKLPITVTINGGTISGDYAIYEEDVQGNNDESDVTIKVNGGTLTGTEAAISTETENLTVSSTVTLNGETNLVAEYSGIKYTSLDAALEAASDSYFALTVKLLADVEYDSSIDVTASTFKSGLYLDLNGHTLDLGSGSINVSDGGTLSVADSAGGGSIISDTYVVSVDGSGSQFTLNGGTLTSDYYGVYCMNGGSVTVNDGTISAKYAALAGNNTTGNMNFEINGGTLTAQYGPAIYMPGQVTLTINGGTLNGGVSLRMGQVTITGGTLIAITDNIDDIEDYYDYSGNVWLGDALYVLAGTYTSDDTTYSNSLNINISGGEFICDNDSGNAVAIYNLGKVAQESTVTITGGTFTSANGEAYTVITLDDLGITDSTYSAVTNTVTSAISGGSFSNDVTAYVVTGYVATYSNGMFIVNAATTIIGPFYMNEYYHGMLINGTLTTFLHTVNDEGYCTTCGGYIGVETGEVVEETVEIEDPVEGTDTVTEDDGEEESSAIETPVDTETETNPTTGMAIAFLPMAMAALAAVVTKK